MSWVMWMLVVALISATSASPSVFMSSPFDNFRIECTKAAGTVQLGINMIESAGSKRQDVLFQLACQSIQERYPWNIPMGIAEMEREDCYYSNPFDPILDEDFPATCRPREYMAGITRMADTKIQLMCCRLRTRDEANCREVIFNKPLGASRSTIIKSDDMVINSISIVNGTYLVRLCDLVPREADDIYNDVASAQKQVIETTTAKAYEWKLYKHKPAPPVEPEYWSSSETPTTVEPEFRRAQPVPVDFSIDSAPRQEVKEEDYTSSEYDDMLPPPPMAQMPKIMQTFKPRLPPPQPVRVPITAPPPPPPTTTTSTTTTPEPQSSESTEEYESVEATTTEQTIEETTSSDFSSEVVEEEEEATQPTPEETTTTTTPAPTRPSTAATTASPMVDEIIRQIESAATEEEADEIFKKSVAALLEKGVTVDNKDEDVSEEEVTQPVVPETTPRRETTTEAPTTTTSPSITRPSTTTTKASTTTEESEEESDEQAAGPPGHNALNPGIPLYPTEEREFVRRLPPSRMSRMRILKSDLPLREGVSEAEAEAILRGSSTEQRRSPVRGYRLQVEEEREEDDEKKSNDAIDAEEEQPPISSFPSPPPLNYESPRHIRRQPRPATTSSTTNEPNDFEESDDLEEITTTTHPPPLRRRKIVKRVKKIRRISTTTTTTEEPTTTTTTTRRTTTTQPTTTTTKRPTTTTPPEEDPSDQVLEELPYSQEEQEQDDRQEEEARSQSEEEPTERPLETTTSEFFDAIRPIPRRKISADSRSSEAIESEEQQADAHTSKRGRKPAPRRQTGYTFMDAGGYLDEDTISSPFEEDLKITSEQNKTRGRGKQKSTTTSPFFGDFQVDGADEETIREVNRAVVDTLPDFPMRGPFDARRRAPMPRHFAEPPPEMRAEGEDRHPSTTKAPELPKDGVLLYQPANGKPMKMPKLVSMSSAEVEETSSSASSENSLESNDLNTQNVEELLPMNTMLDARPEKATKKEEDIPKASFDYFGVDYDWPTPTPTTTTTTLKPYDPSVFYHTARPHRRGKETVLTFCTKDVALRDTNNLVIACGSDLEEWQPTRCPPGSGCLLSEDSTYRICCPIGHRF